MEGWTLYSLALWGGALALASAAAWMLWRKLGAELGFSHSVSTGKRGLRVVITGGSRGIGLALAREFVQLGDKVCIVGRNGAALDKAAKELSTTEGAVVRGAVADITSASDVKAMMESAVAALGGVDIVVHNAGAAQPVNAPLTDTPAADIESVLRVNCLGSLLVSREAIATMSASGGGHLFLMDGAGSDGMTTPSFATYGFSKAGLPQLIRTLNRECQGRGVVVHGMSPGMVLTSLLLRRVRRDNGTGARDPPVRPRRDCRCALAGCPTAAAPPASPRSLTASSPPAPPAADEAHPVALQRARGDALHRGALARAPDPRWRRPPGARRQGGAAVDLLQVPHDHFGGSALPVRGARPHQEPAHRHRER